MSPLPDTALALWHLRWRRRLPVTLALVVGVCAVITVLLSLLGDGEWGRMLLFTACITGCCLLINDGGSMLHAWLHDRLRAWRGLAPSSRAWHSGWAGVFPSTVLCILLGPPLGQALAGALVGVRTAPLFDLGSRDTQITLLLSLLATLAFVAVYSSRERLAEARAQAEAAQRAAAENQLRLLQSQLEPHMLFNTLANLRVLIGLDAQAAQQMLDRLIAFLRVTLEASRASSHPLATEFARVADYLALMSVRMGARLQTRLELPPDLARQPVPPLLLQPLVENAIRHGLEPQVDGGDLVVSAHADAGTLVLTVRDTGVGLAAASAQGTTGTRFGLRQVRERLATLHGPRASLHIEPAPDGPGTVATLRLPLATPAP